MAEIVPNILKKLRKLGKNEINCVIDINKRTDDASIGSIRWEWFGSCCNNWSIEFNQTMK